MSRTRLSVLALPVALLLSLGLAACEDETPTTASGSSSATASSPEASSTVLNEDQSVFELPVGTCRNSSAVADEEVSSVTTVECSSAHDAEVYADGQVTGYSSYPGDSSIQAAAQSICLDGFEAYVGTTYDTSSYEVSWFYPTQETWNSTQKDRTVSCMLVSRDGSQLVGSAQGSKR